MEKELWRAEIKKVLDKRKWDYKEWHRAIGVSQWKLETLMTGDNLEIDEEGLDQLYSMTKQAKKVKLLRFPMPVVIAVWTHKGGTGKSTTATNLSYELSRRGYNVLAIDTDSQADMTSVLYPDYLERPEINFYEAFVMHNDFKEDGYVISTDYDNLDIIPGSTKCENIENVLSALSDDIRYKIFEKCLRQIKKDNYYDFIVIDMDKTAGLMNKSILCQANYILSPIECGIFSIKSTPPILAQIEEVKKYNPKLELLGVLFNRVDLRKKRTVPESIEFMNKIAPGAAFENFMKNDANIDNSQREHLPLGVYFKGSNANKQMMKFTNEFLKRVEERSKGEVM